MGPHCGSEGVDSIELLGVHDGEALVGGKVRDLAEVAMEGLVGEVPELGVEGESEELLGECVEHCVAEIGGDFGVHGLEAAVGGQGVHDLGSDSGPGLRAVACRAEAGEVDPGELDGFRSHVS